MRSMLLVLVTVLGVLSGVCKGKIPERSKISERNP